MATKLCLALLATSLAFFLVADASILRTTIAAEIEEENPFHGEGGSSQCRQFRGMDLTPCIYWMHQVRRGGGWELNLSGGFRIQCCMMLNDMDEKCRCKVLENTVRDQCKDPSSFQGSQGQLCSQKVLQKLKYAPKMCGLESETCHFRMLVA